MCRDTCRHTDCDSFCTINQKIRHAHRKHKRFFLRLIKVRAKINDILIKVSQTYFLRELCKTCLCITHRSSSVSLNGSKVTVSVHKNLSLLKLLRHYYKRIVDGTVSMRMVFTHRISDNTCTLTIRLIITDTKFVHIIKCTTLNRLETITDIRKCSGDNNTHRIINIRFLHKVRIFCSYDL